MINFRQTILKITSDKNNKEVTKNVFFSLVIKGFALLLSILTVPAYTKYFANDAVYGVWLTIAAVFTWINTFDFGIGNGLRNNLVKTIANKDINESKKYVSSAYISIGCISLVFLLIGLILFPFINWNSLLNISSSIIDNNTLLLFITIVFVGVIIQFFFLLITSVFYAIQKTFWPSLLALITQLMILIYISFFRFDDISSKLRGLSIAYVLCHIAPLLIATLIIFSVKLKEIRPSIKFFDKKSARDILNLGLSFFLIQLGLIALNSSNEFYINLLYLPENVTEYNYYFKLFYAITIFVSLLSQPLWSAVTKALYEKRFAWIGKIWKFIIAIALIVVAGSILLGVIYQPLADIWLGKGVLQVNRRSITLFVIMTSEIVIINLVNTFSNGFGVIKCQAVCTILGAILKVFISILFSKIFDCWDAIILSTIIASVPLLVVHSIFMWKYIRNIVKKEDLTND